MHNHLSYKYACDVLEGKINAPKYVILQCKEFKQIADGKSEKYYIDDEKVSLIENVLGLLIMPKGSNCRISVVILHCRPLYGVPG